MNRRLALWSIIPLCLFLISMGVKVPNLANLHAGPKPRPRAIIESSYKNSEDASSQDIAALDLCHPVPVPVPPAVFPVRHALEASLFSSITLAKSGARAPPATC